MNLTVDAAEKTFPVCFAAIPFELSQGDKMTVSVATTESVLTREVTVPKAMSFPSAVMTSFGVDMSSAERNTLVVARLSSGAEYTLDEVSDGVFEMEIPYVESDKLTFIYRGTEYGAMSSSGSGMVDT